MFITIMCGISFELPQLAANSCFGIRLETFAEFLMNRLPCFYNLHFRHGIHHSLAETASAVTLSGSQVGNACPFPALKAGLSPSCSPRWVPHCFQLSFAQKRWIPLETEATTSGLLPKRKSQTNLGEAEDKRCQLFEP